MFWNDPHLYGATFPYREINTPLPTPLMGPTFSPWQGAPRFMPPQGAFPGFNPLAYPTMDIPRFLPPQGVFPGFNPLAYPTMDIPRFVPPVNVPQAGLFPFTPYAQPFNLNLPFYNWYRPPV